MKKALITGITGQDAAYLSELLLSKGYEVHGASPRRASGNYWRLQSIGILDDEDNPRDKNFKLKSLDVTCSSSVTNIIKDGQYDEIYNLAAQSFVAESFNSPTATFNINAIGVLNLLEAIKINSPESKFYQASTSEMFGLVNMEAQNEETPFHPRSPYGVAKVAAHYAVCNYREAYGLFASCGILFNHESPLRGIEFVTRKITDGVAKIIAGKQEKLSLGNLDAYRDWGHAKDYCINKDVPMLTPNGWKYFNELNIGDEVINFNPETNSLSRDIILQVVEPKIDSSKKIRLTGRSIDLTCTQNHRIYYQQKSINSKGGWSDWKVTTASEFNYKLNILENRSKYDYRLPHFQDYNGIENNKVTDNQIYLVGALLAEGHLRTIHKQGRGHNVTVSQSEIANPRIHNKIKSILDNFNFKYSERLNNSGVTEWVINAENTEDILKWFDSNDLHKMPTWCFSLSQRQSKILFDSMMDCDGCWGSMQYISKRYKLLTDFQTIAAISGYQTTNPKQDKFGCWRIASIVQRRKYSYITKAEEIDDGITDVWCITTNNGTIISRDKGLISISGNCYGMYLMMQQETPDDYVLATGVKHSVRDVLRICFERFDMFYPDYVEMDQRYMRPSDVPLLLGDATKAHEKLNWHPSYDFELLITEMLDYDLACQGVDAIKLLADSYK